MAILKVEEIPTTPKRPRQKKEKTVNLAEVTQLPVQHTAPQVAPQPVKQDKTQAQLAILAVLQSAALILAIRFFLLLTLIGGFVISLIATNTHETTAIIVLVIYCLLILLPVVYLETKNKRG